MKPTIVQGEGVTLVIGACSHDNEQTSVGPTTDQINHWCPDCLSRWTTWPDRAAGVRAVDEALLERLRSSPTLTGISRVRTEDLNAAIDLLTASGVRRQGLQGSPLRAPDAGVRVPDGGQSNG